MEQKVKGRVRLRALVVVLVVQSNWSLGISRDLESLRLREEMALLEVVVVALVEDLSSTSSEAISLLLSLSRGPTGLALILSLGVWVARKATMLDTYLLAVARLELLKVESASVDTVDHSVKLALLELSSMDTPMAFANNATTSPRIPITMRLDHQALSARMSAVMDLINKKSTQLAVTTSNCSFKDLEDQHLP
jgi:hypothetical protein